MESLVDHLERWVALKPDQCLCCFLDRDGRERERYSYRSFDERTRYLAEYFTDELGLQFGDRVLLVYPPGLETIAAFFGCVRIGAIPVPICPPTTLRLEGGLSRLLSTAEDCGASLALTTRRLLESWQHHLERKHWHANGTHSANAPRLRWSSTDDREGNASGRVCERTNAVLFLQYTSGSTSDPRGVIVSHENVIHNARSTTDHTPTGVSWLPQYHDMGLIGYHLFPMVMGGTTFHIAPIDFLRRPLVWLETISRRRATYASAPNFAFEYCLREDKVPTGDLAGLDLSSVRVLMNAAEPVRADTFRRFFDRFAPFGLRREAHVAAYGLAEATLAATLYGTRTVTINKRVSQRGPVQVKESCDAGQQEVALVSCGRPLRDVRLRIVDPESRAVLGDGQIGEIWLAGPSVCQGYWQRPIQSEQTFANLLANDEADRSRYLRTGDLGFRDEGELFVCGRIKDVIVIRGVNYFPQDIEHLVASVSPKIRRGGVVAVASPGAAEALAVIAEVENARDLPDLVAIVHAIRTQYSMAPRTVALVPPGSIARTTSGKISRALTRRRWLNGDLRILETFDGQAEEREIHRHSVSEHLKRLLRQLAPEGHEARTLGELAIDSLTLVELIELVRALLQERVAIEWIDEIDMRLLQALSINELLSLADRPQEFCMSTSGSLRDARCARELREAECMRQDARLETLHLPVSSQGSGSPRALLLTGATGFFGPFLLHSLLRETSCRIHVLVRAADPGLGVERLRNSMRQFGLLQPRFAQALDERVEVVCGDLSRRHLGLPPEHWDHLATRVDAVLHNAAFVNYLLNYDALKPHNVDATRELLRFASTGTCKAFHLISSTFIFGWTAQETLHETDCNAEMANLDFGYAQSKWVAEQLVIAAQRQGLPARIYRPSLISASTVGMGSRDDVAVRLLAFMINHGIAVNAKNQVSFLPADIAADEIAAIFGLREIDGRTLHVTVDGYYSMIDVTRILTRDHGYQFDYYDVPDFVAEMNRRCGKDEPLYPLLEFFNRAHTRIGRMERKRYDNRNYRAARALAGERRGHLPLEQTVAALVAFMTREGLISLSSRGAATGRAHR